MWPIDRVVTGSAVKAMARGIETEQRLVDRTSKVIAPVRWPCSLTSARATSGERMNRFFSPRPQ